MILIEVFFDYICPYCYRGHKDLLKLLKKYPQIKIVWRPCEAHPRPEPWPLHSDLAIQGMYYVQEHRGDVWNYHNLVYEAHFEKSLDISSPEVLASLASQCAVDAGEFTRALEEGRYEKQVEEGNRLAWVKHGFDAVPSYCSGSRSAGSKDGFLLPARELEAFMRGLLKTE